MLGLCLQKIPCINFPYRVHRRLHTCSLGLLIKLTLEQEVGITQAKFQQFQDIIDGH